MDNYADELQDSPGDFTPEDERSGGEEEETDDDSISLAEAILMKNKREKGKAKGKHGAIGIGGKAKTKEKPGRKAIWSEDWTNDLVDIICSNDVHQKKLIFTNVKTVKNGEYYEKIIQELKWRCGERNEQFIYDVGHTREKFKRCIATCKEAMLTMKTASGIKRFQDEKSLGKWFNILLPLVQSRVSCQPEQGVEPSTCTKRKSSSQLDSVDDPQSNEGEATIDDITSGSENLTASVRIQRIKILPNLHCLLQ